MYPLLSFIAVSHDSVVKLSANERKRLPHVKMTSSTRSPTSTTPTATPSPRWLSTAAIRRALPPHRAHHMPGCPMALHPWLPLPCLEATPARCPDCVGVNTRAGSNSAVVVATVVHSFTANVYNSTFTLPHQSDARPTAELPRLMRPKCAMRYVAVAAQPPCRIPDRHG